MKNDIAMKFLLRNCLQQGVFAKHLIGHRHIAKWLNTELSKPELLKADLLGEASDGELIHIEVQSTNDPDIAFRMLRYFVAIQETYDQPCHQVVLYVGKAKMTNSRDFQWPHGSAKVTQIDVRDLDGGPLLESPELSDNIISVLARLKDKRQAVHQVVKKIVALDPDSRVQYFQALCVLAGLRDIENEVKEASKSVLDIQDILDNKILGPSFKSGLEQGREEGLQKGKLEGERRIILEMIREKFGAIPASIERKVSECADLTSLSKRLLHAATLDDLFA